MGDVIQEFAWFSIGVGGQGAERAPDDLDGIPIPQVPGEVEINGKAQYSILSSSY
jgi:hypothetical protein